MVLFTAFMMWSFSSKEYRALRKDRPHTNPFMAFLHSLNYWDFIQDAAASTAFFFKISPHKSQMHSDFDSAFDTGDTPNISSSLNLDEQMQKWMALWSAGVGRKCNCASFIDYYFVRFYIQLFIL